mmetsp:Transcript_9020/g.21957  ORF Transcript_9020/g.21957 Transcript_9020/m.21957 type:complete len:111 (+) Transcript_9020:153-485(+)
MTSHTNRPSSQSSSSVFDRLYSKSTESSRLRQSAGKEPVNTGKKTISSNRRPRTVLKSKTNLVRPETKNSSSGVYDRLYSKGTASYNSKKKIASANDKQNSSDKIASRAK